LHSEEVEARASRARFFPIDHLGYAAVKEFDLYSWAMTDSTTLSQRYFELDDIRAIQGRSWIPLRQDGEVERESPFTGVGNIREYSGLASLAVQAADREAVDPLDWGEIDVATHRPSLDQGVYRPADVHCGWTDERKTIGTRVVIAQEMSGFDSQTWHLHQDLVIALGLEREGDVWFRPDEGWLDVARLKRNEQGRPILLDIRAEMLSDYLAARDMSLFLSSYHERAAYFTSKPAYSWADQPREWAFDRDRHEQYIVEAEFPPDPSYHHRGLGALWRTEWFEPGKQSTRVRGDAESNEVSFAVGPNGERKTATQCIGTMTYLAFKPTLVPALLHYRGGFLGWYSRETGGMGAADTGIHFGINSLGLITIFAKDIAKLDGWEQRTWAAHSTPLDGGASRELFDAQMNCKPAHTVAPETRIKPSIEALAETFRSHFGTALLRDHASIDTLLKRTHRFRAVEQDGLLALAKELNRLFMERIELDVLRGPAGIGPKEQLRSLKALERLVEKSLGQAAARSVMAPLFGINDLRNADAHLGTSLIQSGLERAKVDTATADPAEQGCQLLEAFVTTVGAIEDAIAQGVSGPPGGDDQ
jgi:hypothetical protein